MVAHILQPPAKAGAISMVMNDAMNAPGSEPPMILANWQRRASKQLASERLLLGKHKGLW